MHITVILFDRHPGNPNAFTNFINVNEAFVEIIKDFESKAMQSGSEVKSILKFKFDQNRIFFGKNLFKDPDVSATLQKCEEYIPGKF